MKDWAGKVFAAGVLAFGVAACGWTLGWSCQQAARADEARVQLARALTSERVNAGTKVDCQSVNGLINHLTVVMSQGEFDGRCVLILCANDSTAALLKDLKDWRGKVDEKNREVKDDSQFNFDFEFGSGAEDDSGDEDSETGEAEE